MNCPARQTCLLICVGHGGLWKATGRLSMEDAIRCFIIFFSSSSYHSSYAWSFPFRNSSLRFCPFVLHMIYLVTRSLVTEFLYETPDGQSWECSNPVYVMDLGQVQRQNLRAHSGIWGGFVGGLECSHDFCSCLQSVLGGPGKRDKNKAVHLFAHGASSLNLEQPAWEVQVATVKLMALTFGIRLKGLGHHGGIEVRFEFVDFAPHTKLRFKNLHPRYKPAYRALS